MDNREKLTIEEEVKRLNALKMERMKELFSSDEWIRQLKLNALFPNYSAYNCTLLYKETEGKATLVMSAKAWNKINRYPKKGSKALRVIAPCPYKKKQEKIMTDINGSALRTTTGKVMTEIEEVTVTKFKAVPVFDISQTEGEPLPKTMVDELKGNVDRFDIIRDALAEYAPVPIVYREINSGAKGYYSPAQKNIVIKNDLSPRHQIHTILHETAHCLLDLSGEDKTAGRSLKELEAESIAFTVMAHLLKDEMSPEEIGQYSFGYLGSWTGSDKDLNELKGCMDTVQKTSCKMIEEIDRIIESKLLSEKDQIVYRLYDGFLHITKSDERFVYEVYNCKYQIVANGSVVDTSNNIMNASHIIMNELGISPIGMAVYDMERFSKDINMSDMRRQILATEICMACYGEDPVSKTYVGQSEQEVFKALTYGKETDAHRLLRKISVADDVRGINAAALFRGLEETSPVIKNDASKMAINRGVSI